VLVTSELALSLLLLVGAGLLMRSFISLVRVDLGFDPRNILVFFVTPPPGEHTTTAARRQLDDQLLERIRSLPGIEAAAVTTNVAPFSAGYRSLVEIQGRPSNAQWTAFALFCSDGYFRTMGIPFLRGGEWPAGPATESRRLAVVNQTFAESYLAGDDALASRITLTLPSRSAPQLERREYEIVGVVGDIRNQGIREPRAPQVYLAGVTTLAPPTILVRTAADPRSSISAIRTEIKRVDRKLAVREPGTIEDILRRSAHAQPRFSVLVLGAFAAAGTLLVAIGVFGVMAYTVARQTREIAVRMALGAKRRDVLAAVLASGVRLLFIGVAAGVLASFAAARLISHQLWNTSPYDPLVFAGAVAVITAVALAACYVPARRAMHVDPMQALRAE
jgi:putative ABC transport system permease protein